MPLCICCIVAKIVPAPNGSLYYISDPEPSVVENLVGPTGEPLKTVKKVALCRCGQSRSKPFCDGSHIAAGFSDKNEQSQDSPPDRRKDYVGKSITVHDNRAICAHAAECLRSLPAVFRLGERPWVNPDGADVQKVIETVRKCPSGALSYSIDGVEHRDNNDGLPPMIKVLKNGPYHVTGGVELAGAKWAQGASKEHYTLCRCGASGNKPFCDGTHRQIMFRDDGQ